MEQRHRDVLRNNTVRLGEDLTVKEDFLEVLYQERIITADMKEEIEVLSTRRKKVSNVLSILPRRGPKAFRAFILALVKTDQLDLAETLDKTLTNQCQKDLGGIYEPNPIMQPIDVIGPCITPSSQESSVDDEVDEPLDMKQTGLLNVEVKKVSEDSGLRKLFASPPPSVYKMNRNPRGRALIINNKNFPKRSEQERAGTDMDSTNIEQLLLQLAYDVHLETDLTAEDMRKVLSIESQQQEHDDADSFVCVILSHGMENAVFGVDDGVVNIKDIVDYFDNVNCPRLSQKPKLFILQACQGNEFDYGANAEQTDAYDDPTSRRIEETRRGIEKMNIDTPKVSTKGDTLVAYAAVEGFRSWRNAEFGTWFIRAIVEVFMGHSHRLHVSDLLMKVRRVIGKSESLHERRYKQMTAEYGSFAKHMYFFPGLALDENDQNVASGR